MVSSDEDEDVGGGEEMKRITKLLSRGVGDLKTNKVPPPSVYQGYNSVLQIDTFLENFERCIKKTRNHGCKCCQASWAMKLKPWYVHMV